MPPYTIGLYGMAPWAQGIQTLREARREAARARRLEWSQRVIIIDEDTGQEIPISPHED